MSDSETIYMFDKELLNGLELQVYAKDFENPEFNYLEPCENLVLRPLSNKDYEKGFTNLLSQLTKLGSVSKEDFIKRFNAMKKAESYFPIVIEDTIANEGQGLIVATGTLTIEQKFIHSCATRGRVEEIVVDKGYRRKKLGSIILGSVTSLGKNLGVYKITLECLVENIPFYEKFKYVVDHERFLQQRFRD